MTPDQEKKLFEDIGSIKSDLRHGQKAFREINESLKELQKIGKAIDLHLDRHKTVRWVLGGLTTLAGLLKIGTIISWFKG